MKKNGDFHSNYNHVAVLSCHAGKKQHRNRRRGRTVLHHNGLIGSAGVASYSLHTRLTNLRARGVLSITAAPWVFRRRQGKWAHNQVIAIIRRCTHIPFFYAEIIHCLHFFPPYLISMLISSVEHMKFCLLQMDSAWRHRWWICATNIYNGRCPK